MKVFFVLKVSTASGGTQLSCPKHKNTAGVMVQKRLVYKKGSIFDVECDEIQIKRFA